MFPSPVPLKKTMSDVFGGKKVNKNIGFTLRCGGKSSPITDRRNWDGYLVDGAETRLSPVEGKKMMGFPAWFHFPVSDGIAMKQLGNSVAVPVIKAINKNILKVLNHE